MNKESIFDLLKKNHSNFIELIASMNENDFCKHVTDKWTPAQQAEHIHKSIHPLLLAFKLPLFIPGLLFGKANRPSKSYEALVEKYHQKLLTGYKAGRAYIPKEVTFNQKSKLISRLRKDVFNLCKLVDRLNEEQLDKYILPHPLLGKLTIREMLYFTAYHVQHHQKNIEIILQS